MTELTHLKAKKPGRGDGSALVRKVQSIGKPLAVSCDSAMEGFYTRLGFEPIQRGKPCILVWLGKKQATA